MKRRIIINIRDDTDTEKALFYVNSVIKMGRISENGNSYCYCSMFEDNVVVLAKATNSSDIFDVYTSKQQFDIVIGGDEDA